LYNKNEKREEHDKYFEEKYGKDSSKWSEEVWDSYSGSSE